MTVTHSTGQLVFVPRIGFRPAGTRMLTEPRETFAHETRLTLLAVAAAPDRTDVVVEWERDSATCTADTQLVAAFRYKEHEPLDWMTITLDTGASEVKAIASARPAYSYGERMSAAQTITFPPLAGDRLQSELRVSEGGQAWRVPFTLKPADLNARTLSREVERDGVVVRATALARHADELVVALEAEATLQIRQVGWPVPAPVIWSRDEAELHRLRTKEHRRFFSEHFGARIAPITLEDDRGGHGEEVRRLFSTEPQRTAPGEPFISRFSVIFEAPSVEASLAVLVVPFVALNDPEHSMTVDLRDVPVDVALGQHRFRVVRTEAHGAEQRKVVIEIPPSTASPRLAQPRRMQGADPENVAWQSGPADSESAGAIWMATAVGDPPVVTFQGAVLRVDGPWRFELPLD